MQQTSDGGYVVAGGTRQSGGVLEQYFLLKTDSCGNVEWQRIDSSASGSSLPCVIQTADGGYVAAGHRRGTQHGIQLVKLDPSGNLQWTSMLDSAGVGFSVLQTTDEGYLVSGLRPVADSGVCLIKADSLGNRQWEKLYPMYVGMHAYYIPLARTSDNGYIVGAKTLIKVDSLGNQQWARTFAGVLDACAVLQMNDQGYVATGSALGDTYPNWAKAYLLRTDSLGNLEWIRKYGSIEVSGGGASVAAAQDGGYLIGGEMDTDTSTVRTVLWRVDSEGAPMWTVTRQALGSISDIRQTRDGGYIAVGGHLDRGVDASGSLLLMKLASEDR